jgi:hypothetical protein
MRPQPVVRLVVVAAHRRFFDRAVHPFDLAVRPRVVRLREPVLDREVGAGELERVATERLAGVSHASERRVTLSCNSAKANLLVRSMATSK